MIALLFIGAWSWGVSVEDNGVSHETSSVGVVHEPDRWSRCAAQDIDQVESFAGFGTNDYAPRLWLYGEFEAAWAGVGLEYDQ